MKEPIKNLLRRLISLSPLAIRFVGIVRTHLSVSADSSKYAKESRSAYEKFREAHPELTVLNGPFRGMVYPSRDAAGSELYPKILGSYERELHETLDYISEQRYTSVVDIGCAEGYYAIGFGMILKGAKIYAFDTSSKAISLCSRMAETNGVDVKLGGHCDKETLLGLNLGKRALIFSDCEGYENHLFDLEVAQKLSGHDFLIETHDFIDIETTGRIQSIFRDTHECSIIESVDDIIKAYTYEFEELEGFSLKERLYILGERRPTVMRWIFARSAKKSS